jgi:hypothetical protein
MDKLMIDDEEEQLSSQPLSSILVHLKIWLRSSYEWRRCACHASSMIYGGRELQKRLGEESFYLAEVAGADAAKAIVRS